MTTFKLSTRAATDIDDLFEYGIENYGLNRATAYVTGLSGAIERLCDHPMLGRRADALAMDLRRLEYKTHIVFSQLNRECIHIGVLGIFPRNGTKVLQVIENSLSKPPDFIF